MNLYLVQLGQLISIPKKYHLGELLEAGGFIFKMVYSYGWQVDGGYHLLHVSVAWASFWHGG